MIAAALLHLIGLQRVAAAALPVPRYSATRPDYQRPLGGLAPLPHAEHITVFAATEQTGTYNHQPMLARHGGAFHVAWKNSAFNEDQDGQRILYASSADGRNWSQAVDLFPSMPAHDFGCDPLGSASDRAPHCFDKIHHEGTPFVTLNGRLYAVSGVRRHGAPASFYPTPAQDLNTTLLRRILRPATCTPGGCALTDPRSGDGACPATAMRWQRPVFGPLFWASAWLALSAPLDPCCLLLPHIVCACLAADVIPDGYHNITRAFGIRQSSEEALSPEDRRDFALFRDSRRAQAFSPDACRNGPCNGNNTGVYENSGTSLRARQGNCIAGVWGVVWQGSRRSTTSTTPASM